MCNLKESTFPVIYFSFNSIWIEPSERAKVKEIADRLKADKSIRIRVTGWCDPVGSDAANQRVSLQRAEAVKRVLGQWLIPADRVETAGGGVCGSAASHEEARCAITIEILK
jgi:outer membrane protein OmpA-like peptidoglycan-associated protein